VLRGLQPDAIFASARTGEGIDAILERIGELLPRPEVEVSLLVPFDRGDVIAMLHDRFEVVREVYEEAGTRIDAKVNDAALSQLDEFRVPAA
jgi:GTPase